MKCYFCYEKKIMNYLFQVDNYLHQLENPLDKDLQKYTQAVYLQYKLYENLFFILSKRKNNKMSYDFDPILQNIYNELLN